MKTNLDRLGGKVEIDSVPGKGSAFRIKLPLTLAIIPSLLVSDSGERFAIAQVSVGELIRIPADQIEDRTDRAGDAELVLLARPPGSAGLPFRSAGKSAGRARIESAQHRFGGHRDDRIRAGGERASRYGRDRGQTDGPASARVGRVCGGDHPGRRTSSGDSGRGGFGGARRPVAGVGEDFG